MRNNLSRGQQLNHFQGLKYSVDFKAHLTVEYLGEVAR